ncbi:MAG: outer membrane protein assembly factor BamC [Burkholderiales bacterium]
MKLTTIISCAVITVLALGACSTSKQGKIDYKSAKSLPPLEVPPDLAVPDSSTQFDVVGKDGTTYSDYTRARAAAKDSAGQDVLPTLENMRVERDGQYRWLVVQMDPKEIWQPLREFWQENGFLLARESPEIGFMETDWAENRALVSNSWFRRTFAFMGAENAFSYPERDKFRTRVERGDAPGTTDIYISHRGVVQIATREGTINRTVWEARPRDPELEAEMLYRLMARLGATKGQIEQARNEPPPAPRAELASGPNDVSYLELPDSFDRAWRRVGIALDFIGFTVEDQDRSTGEYFVRYNDPDAEQERSGLARLAFWKDDKPVAQKYRIRVSKGKDDGSEVHVLDDTGKVLANSTSSRILVLLRDQLQ